VTQLGTNEKTTLAEDAEQRRSGQ